MSILCTLVVQLNTNVMHALCPTSVPEWWKKKTGKCCSSYTSNRVHCRKHTILCENEADITYHEKWHPKSVIFVQSVKRWLAYSFVCAFSWWRDNSRAQFVKKERPNSSIFCWWPAGIYSYIKICAFLVILMSHFSPVVVFRLGKTVANFRSGDSKVK